MKRRANFDLARVIAAAGEGRVLLGKTRCRDILLDYLGELAMCHEFACAVAAALEPGDFNAAMNLEGIDFDEYGIRLSDEMLERFGLDEVAWYLKLTLKDGTWGDEAFFLSFRCTLLKRRWNAWEGC